MLYSSMRQKFDVGDLVEYNNLKGYVIESRAFSTTKNKKERTFHVDEYRCRIQFFGDPQPLWIRAKWLKHVSKINQ